MSARELADEDAVPDLRAARFGAARDGVGRELSKRPLDGPTRPDFDDCAPVMRAKR